MNEPHEFDLVLTDHNLGSETGLEMIPKIKHLPVIFLTGSGDETIAVQAMKQGAYDYLIKADDYSHLAVLPSLIENTIRHYQSEVKLKETEERFRNLFQNTHDLIQSVDMNGNFNYINPAWSETLGYEENELPNITIKDILHPNCYASYEQYLKKVLQNNRKDNIDLIFLSKSGEEVMVNGNVLFEFVNEEPVAVTGIFRNDTKRRLAAAKLAESEERYRFIVENANDIIFKTDTFGNCLYVNEVATHITGYPIATLLKMNYLELVLPEDHESVTAFYANQFMEKTRHSYFEYRMRKKTGELLWMGQNARAVFEPGSRHITGFILIARDITERKKIEKELLRKNLLLESQQKEITLINKSLHKVNDVLTEKNRSITDSINYAKRIQDRILVSTEELGNYFDDYFVIYKPKDIVSGDFYWAHKLADGTILWAVADCTGHGVPGAFMSMLSVTLLNEIVIEKGVSSVDTILNLLRESVIKVMKHNDEESVMKDGLDIALCALSPQKRQVGIFRSG